MSDIPFVLISVKAFIHKAVSAKTLITVKALIHKAVNVMALIRFIKTRTTCFSNSFCPKAIQTKPPNTKSKEQEGKKVEKKERGKEKKKEKRGWGVGGGGAWGEEKG